MRHSLMRMQTLSPSPYFYSLGFFKLGYSLIKSAYYQCIRLTLEIILDSTSCQLMCNVLPSYHLQKALNLPIYASF